ncbi:MAG: hypothetical protein LBQ22_11415 [Bacteroidales bacterium]|nr:hypothetical protein [Bacteroidales bacterium]
MSEKVNKQEKTTKTVIKSCNEEYQDVQITIDELNAEKKTDKKNDILSDEEIKASVEKINPDSGTLDRG